MGKPDAEADRCRLQVITTQEKELGNVNKKAANVGKMGSIWPPLGYLRLPVMSLTPKMSFLCQFPDYLEKSVLV